MTSKQPTIKEQMDRYNFIRFGGHVQWADDSTDTIREMQVCLPPREPIGDDTEIELIATGEELPEEVSVSYSVRAAELIPWLKPFQEEYWKALQDAAENGADEETLSAMLGSAGLCMEECVYLALRSDAYKLYPALCRLFPGTEETLRVLTWNGCEYFARKLVIFRGTKDEQEILVSVTSLQDRLIDDETGIPVSDGAEKMDGEIYYYLRKDEIILPDERIVTIAEDA